MPGLTFGSGEPVTRLRRSLDVKGRVGLALDDIIVPVTVVDDATGPPFRKTGVRWWVSVFVAAVAGEFGRVRLRNPTGTDQLLDFVQAQCPSAPMRWVIGSGPTTATPTIFARTSEGVDVNALGGVPSRALPLGVQVDSVTPTSISASTNRSLSALADVNADLGRAQNFELVLPAQVGNAQSILTIESNTANTAYNLTLSGQYWDDLPLNVQT